MAAAASVHGRHPHRRPSTGITHDLHDEAVWMLSAGIVVRLLGATAVVAVLWVAVAWALSTS